MKPIELLDQPNPANTEELETLANPPSDLIDLLKYTNGGMPDRTNSFIDRSLLTDMHCSISLEYLLSVCEIHEVKEEYGDRIQTDLFPFGDDGAGNYICINGQNNVLFWDHEFEGTGQNTIKVAESLDHFLDLLGPE